MRREGILKEKLQPVLRRYDYILIDCPPALSLITINAFVASDDVIVPLQCEYFGMKGMQQLQRSVADLQLRALRKAARILGGEQRLRDLLDAPPGAFSRWMQGAEAVPTPIFLMLVDFLADGTYEPVDL